MGGGDLNLKKSWHPHTLKNQERVWKAEQAKQNEQRKLDDLRKEIDQERDREELRRLGQNSGVLAHAGGGEAKLEWMYKNNNELINREEYLLGRKIDKSFEALEAEERRQQHSAMGVKQPINHVEHECVPFSIREYRNLQSTEQVDMQRKTIEDPLMLIKQREMESRRKLLENPIKLKEIHRILKTEQELKESRNKKTKKPKKSKKKKNRKCKDQDESNSSGSDDDLDKKLAKQVKKLKSDGSNDNLKLDKLLDAKYRTISKQLDMATKQKKSKKSKKRRDSSTSSSSSSSSSSSNDIDSSNSSEDSAIRQKTQRNAERREHESNNSRHNATKDRENVRRRNGSRSPRQRRQSRSVSPRRNQRGFHGRNHQQQQRRHSRSSSPRTSQRRQSRSASPRRKRNERPTQRRSIRSASPSQTKMYQQRVERPNRRRPSPSRDSANKKQKLTDAERDARLREMMENATWREADRTKAVQKHREAYAREEAENKARDFDKEFINKEVKKAIANQTSIGNRIRSNLNNIQRSASSMDTNFARK